MSRVPVVELSECTGCEGCLELCPEVFRRNEAGFIEVLSLSVYSDECVEEAMKCCPADCIFWEVSE